MRLCFRVPARCVRFLQTPSHFFQVSSFLISRAERRVALAALYVGSGPRERFLVDLLRQRMQDVACKRECDRPGGVFRDFLWREEQTGAGSGETLAAKAAQRRGGQRREENNGGSERRAASARTERESEADFESRRRRLQVDILVDHLRGTRKDKTGCSSASVLASLLKREERVSEVDVLSTGADLSPQFCRPGHENSSNASALKASSPSSSSTVSPSSSSSPSRSSECSSSLSSTRSSPSSSPSLASFSGEEDLARISFFHNPLTSSSLLGRLLPPRVNEVLGVQHMKALVVDDAVLLTGANFSEEYMVNRADRYVVVNDAAVAHAVCRLIQTVQRGSFCLRLREQRRGEEAPGEADATRGRLSEAPENRPTNARTAAGGEETGARGFDCVTATSTETRSAHRGAEGGEERFAGLDSEAKNGGKAARSRSRGEDEGGAEAQRGERGKNGGRVETEDAKERGEDDFDVVWDPQFTLTSNPTQDPAAFSRDFYRLLKEACEGVSSTAFLASEVKPYNAKTEAVSCTPSTQSKEASCDAGHPATRGQVLVETAGDSGVCTLELALQAGFTNPPVDDLARVLDEIFVEAGSEGSPSAVSGSECMKNSPNAEESTHVAPPFRPASRSEEDAGRASTAASSGSSSVVSEDEKDAATPPYSSTNVSKAVVLASPYLNLPTRLLRRLAALCVEHSDALESRPEAPRAERELAATSGICDEVLRSRKMAVVTASPQANSFHKSKGVSRYIPEAYAYIAYRVSRLLEHAAHKTPSAGRGFLGHRHPREARDSDAEAAVHAQRELCSARLSEKSIGSSRPGSEAVALQTTGGRPPACRLLFEYCSPGWTFHTKGIWLFADEKTQERRKAVGFLPDIPDRTACGATETARHRGLVDPQREEGCFSFSSAGSRGRNSSEFLFRTSPSVRQRTCKAKESSGLTVQERGSEETQSVELRARSRTAGPDLEEARKPRGESPSMLPYLTVFGSSNFSERAEHRDLELSCVLRTRDRDLQKQMKAEVEQVLKHSKPVEADSVKSRFGWVTLLAVQWRLVKSLL